MREEAEKDTAAAGEAAKDVAEMPKESDVLQRKERRLPTSLRRVPEARLQEKQGLQEEDWRLRNVEEEWMRKRPLQVQHRERRSDPKDQPEQYRPDQPKKQHRSNKPIQHHQPINKHKPVLNHQPVFDQHRDHGRDHADHGRDHRDHERNHGNNSRGRV